MDSTEVLRFKKAKVAILTFFMLFLYPLALSAERTPRKIDFVRDRPYPQKLQRTYTVKDGLAGNDVKALVIDKKGNIWFDTNAGVSRFDGKQWKTFPEGTGPVAGRREIVRQAAKLYKKVKGIPYDDLTVVAVGKKGEKWFGTSRGAIKLGPSGWEYYAGRRWLPDDHVNDIAMGKDGAAWIATAKGVSKIYTRMMTLNEKALYFEKLTRDRHVRYGLVADCGLRKPGDLSTFYLQDSDNDGLWTGMYVAAEAFRFAATGDKQARRFAGESLRALIRLEEINGIKGFVSRSFTKKKKTGRKWHLAKDGIWYWKGDTSSDEIVGHFFAYSIYYDLVADEKEKRQIAGVVSRIMNHIIDNNLALVGINGRPTSWGKWSKEYFSPEDWFFEKGLQSLQILSFLKVAYHITGNSKYAAVYDDLVKKGYARNTLWQKINIPTQVNHSDDELAFLSYYPLLLYEKDPGLRRIYLKSITRSWKIDKPEKNPLWDFIYRSDVNKKVNFDLEGAMQTLRDIPFNLVTWNVRNSGRKDIKFRFYKDRFGRKQTRKVLPFYERPIILWNENPYVVDGGRGGYSEQAGTFFLLPYWMGRYHGFIKLVSPSTIKAKDSTVPYQNLKIESSK